ncbi:hypothetical protein [Pleionea sp. CnH1-48]|uniref:hypothetical protein n=1 Tax=Pleionea sp. CnH1-48 TaxID=2954494 RepID=UPI00209854A4|nr:hypothetical protein [Pleionea sp. CnH1-48]MCO7222725.1 hypothetical protein [Pleionea sp. CnH1-48]
MELQNHDRYILSIGDRDLELDNLKDVEEKLTEALKNNSGKVTLVADAGSRPWWQRFFLGAKVYVRMYFTCEWFDNASGVIFYDDAASEYRVVSELSSIDVSRDVREKISFDELQPLDLKYCLSKEQCIEAISRFFEEGEKPKALTYDFVR